MALRAELRAKCEAARQNELFYLVYWGAEGVSIHKENEVNTERKDRREIGDECLAKFGKKLYSGKIACYGTKSEMMVKEKQYLKCTYTPFQTDAETVDKEDSHDQEKECEVVKRVAITIETKVNDKVVTAKKKRRLVSEKLADDQKSGKREKRSKDVDDKLADDQKNDKRKKRSKDVDDKLVDDQRSGKRKKRSKDVNDKSKKKKGNILCVSSPKASEEKTDDSEQSMEEGDSENLMKEDEKLMKEDEKLMKEDEKSMKEVLHYSKDDSEKSVKDGNSKQSMKEDDSKQSMKEDDSERSMKKDDHEKSFEEVVDTNWRYYDDMYDKVLNSEEEDFNMKENNELPEGMTKNSNDAALKEEILQVLNNKEEDFNMKENNELPEGMTKNSSNDAALKEDILQGHKSSNQEEHLMAIQQCLMKVHECLESIATKYSPTPLIDLTNNSKSENTLPSTSVVAKTELSSKNEYLKNILAEKEANPLPAIDTSALIPPAEVVEKHPKLVTACKIPTLAVKLSKASYFGPTIMKLCTVRGTGSYHALPKTELGKLRSFLYELSYPRLVGTRTDFESLWKSCIESVGQACKQLRK